MAQVVFHVAWPAPVLGRASAIPLRTTDIAVRIAHPGDQLKKGTVGHVTRADTSLTMLVEAGEDYQVEALCLYEIPGVVDTYVPIGYGITKDLTLLESVANYVSVKIDTLDLVFVRTDSLSTKDTLAVELHISIDDDWSDFSRYIPDKLGCIVDNPDKLVSGGSVTLKEVSRDTTGVVLAWDSTFKNGGFMAFFVAGNEGDKLTDLTDAFGLTVQAAWSPPDFGESGDRFTIMVIEGAIVIVSIPK